MRMLASAVRATVRWLISMRGMLSMRSWKSLALDWRDLATMRTLRSLASVRSFRDLVAIRHFRLLGISAVVIAVAATLIGASLTSKGERATFAPPPPRAAAGGVAKQLGDRPARYPRVIRLQHSGAANGRIIASASVSSRDADTPDSTQFFESTDDGRTFRTLSTISDPDSDGGRGSCCGSLYELPRKAGSRGEGTLLFATSVGMPNTPDRRAEIRVWASTDHAKTWTFLSNCATATGAPAERGLWAPALSVDDRGNLNCFFSDDSQLAAGPTYDQVVAVTTSTDGGSTWGGRRVVVAIPSTANSSFRPGMANILPLPNGTYFLSYELCGTNIPDACQVRYRISADGWNWGAAGDPGIAAQTPDGKHLYYAPTATWAPATGGEGRILLIGGLVKDASGQILRPASGSTVFANPGLGTGDWYELDSPVTVVFAANPKQEDLSCDNYSSSLLSTVDGNTMLELTTRWEPDGTCAAFYASAKTLGTGSAAGIASGHTYRLRSVHSGQCLAVAGGSTTSAAKTQQSNCDWQDPENWKLSDTGGGFFTITNERSDMCLDLPQGSSKPGTQIQQFACNGTDPQLWRPLNVGREAYNLVSKVSGLCLDLRGGALTAGAPIQQWTCNISSPQIWATQLAQTILPLGDSITDGLDGTGGYRADLWQLLRTDGRFADFLGTQNAGPTFLPDKSHEGHPGARIDYIDSQVANWLPKYKPDVVLLHIGTNDAIQNFEMDKAPAKLSTLIDHITEASPDSEVYVSSIVRLRDPSQETTAEAYNAAIPAIVAQKVASGKHVHFVDLHDVMSVADLNADGIHPSNGGYSKIAAGWYGALTGKPMRRVEAESTTNAFHGTAPSPSAVASGGMKVTGLGNADSSVDIAMPVASSGTYRIFVRTGNGRPTGCGQSVTVNGKAPRTLTYPNYGVDQWSIVATDVTLNAGDNIVQFGQASCSVDLDSVDLAPNAAPSR